MTKGEKWTIQQLKSSKFTDFDKQIVYLGVFDTESKYGFIFELYLLFHCHFGCFCQKTEKKLRKTSWSEYKTTV